MNVEDLHGRVLVDTNVLIYATLRNDFRHAAACSVLEWRRRTHIELFVSVQNLAEMYPNLTGPKTNPPDPPELARRKIDSIAALEGVCVLPLTVEIIRETLRLCERMGVQKQRYFDMQLVALMLKEGLSTLVTENEKDFPEMEGIRVVNPFR